MKGFVREILWIVTLLSGIVLAGLFYHRTAPLFKDFVKTENLALFVAFSAIFVATTDDFTPRTVNDTVGVRGWPGVRP